MSSVNEGVISEEISTPEAVVQTENSSVHERSSKGDERTVDAVEAPDGGWGWMVVFGSFMIHVIADGIAYSFGVYVEDFKDYFDCNSADVGMLGSLILGVTWGTGPIASIFTNKYGCRKITIAGTLIAAFGFIISIFAPNIVFMYFSFGLVAGFGLGMAYLPAIVAVSFYFEKRRSLATGLAVCGSGFGTFIFAPLTNLLLEHYSWKGTVLIETGLLLNCIICGAVFRPVESHKLKTVNVDLENAVAKSETNMEVLHHSAVETNDTTMWRADAGVTESSSASKMSDMARLASSLSTIPHQNSKKCRRRTFSEADKLENGNAELLRPGSRKDIYYPASLAHIPMYKANPDEYKKSMTVIKEERPVEENDRSCVSNFFHSVREFFSELQGTMDISLLWDLVFMIFAISNLLTSIGYCVPYIFLPDRAVTMEIADRKSASFLISIIGITNTIGRIIFGWIADFRFVNRLMLYNTVLVLCGFASLMSSLCLSYPTMAFYSACFGLLVGVYTCLTPIVLVDLLGLEKLSNSFGLVLLFQGIGAVAGPPMAGAVYDHTKNYDNSFYLMGVCIAISGLMLYPIPCIRRTCTKNVSAQEIALGKAPTTTAVARTDDEAALQLSPSESFL